MRGAHASVAARAGLFHSSLAQALYVQAMTIREHTGVSRVGLSGGVFQNRVLTEQVHALLSAAGFEVLMPERTPVNDAAISYGQLIEAIAAQTAGASRETNDTHA
jgi:hydrogenase maturation protein HypF